VFTEEFITAPNTAMVSLYRRIFMVFIINKNAMIERKLITMLLVRDNN
jgi:hypothetical protein